MDRYRLRSRLHRIVARSPRSCCPGHDTWVIVGRVGTQRVSSWGAVAAVLAGGCGFQPQASTNDAATIDGKGDAPTIDGPVGLLPKSCNELHTTSPTLPSGTYAIDPDGDGAGAKLSVTCDMAVDGGGWTIVFFPPSANTTAPPTYTSSSSQLLTDAQSVLMAYRSDAQVVVTSYAVFDLPAQWRVSAPFSYAGNEVSVNARVDGGAPATTMVRYGYGNFGLTCGSPWGTGAPFGRVCLASTSAPFFTGFSDAGPDFCSSSLSNYNSVACTLSTRFSLAVR